MRICVWISDVCSSDLIQLYLANDADLILVAGKQPIAALDWSRIATSQLDPELKRLGVASAQDMQLRRIGAERLLKTYARLNVAKPHSDFYPTVSLLAPKTRFRRDSSLTLQELEIGRASCRERVCQYG